MVNRLALTLAETFLSLVFERRLPDVRFFFGFLNWLSSARVLCEDQRNPRPPKSVIRTPAHVFGGPKDPRTPPGRRL